METKDKKETNKKYMFQYALASGLNTILEDTELISKGEAIALVDKWLEHLKNHWDDYHCPQMAIWQNCEKNTDYHDLLLDIDFRDCELTNGSFYRIKRELIDMKFLL